jgi:cytidine deaminase
MRSIAHDAQPPLSFLRHPDWHALWQLREHLILRAERAATLRGRSYRDFRVGAAAFVTSRQPGRMRALGRTPQHIYTGANWKLGRDERNTCAEQEIVAQLRQNQHLFPARRILALAIYGHAQDEPDAESGIRTLTLHPCRHCRRLLQEIPEMRPDTIIITAAPDGTMELTLFHEILRLHGGA